MKQASQGFGQITAMVSSRREEYEVDGGSGRRKSGSSSGRVFENDSICVFEVSFADSKGRWRLASIVEDERKEDLPAADLASAEGTPQQ